MKSLQLYIFLLNEDLITDPKNKNVRGLHLHLRDLGVSMTFWAEISKGLSMCVLDERTTGGVGRSGKEKQSFSLG